MSDSEKQIHKIKKAFVEEVSLIFEEQGHPRISGQILGWLHVCTPEAQSFNELVKHLNASKASISNMTRLLIQSGFIEKVRKSDDRLTYFKLVDHAWCKVLERQLDIMGRLRDLSSKYQKELVKEGEKETDRLEQMHDFYEFVTDNFPESIEQYKLSCRNGQD